MISQKEIGFQSPRESKFLAPNQGVVKHSAPGGLIYDSNSGSLHYPKPPTFGHLSNVKGDHKVNGKANIHGATEKGSILAVRDNAVFSADGENFDQEGSEETSPRCVIRNSTLESSNSTSPTGSKAVSEMDDYSDVKQLIVHNRSSSPSDADDDAFFGTMGDEKGLSMPGFRSLDLVGRGPKQLDALLRQKNIKGSGELAQKIFQVTGIHSRSMSASGVDPFQNMGKESGPHSESLEKESLQPSFGKPNSTAAIEGSHIDGSQQTKEKQRSGASSVRGSHDRVSLKENGWTPEHEGIQATSIKHSSLEPDQGSLLKTSGADGGDIILYKHQTQRSEKVEEARRKNGLSNSVKAGNLLNGGPCSFSFNQTHVVRGTEPDSLDYDSNYDNASATSFEFNRGDMKGMHRTALSNLTKPAPSKWDDAEKWLSAASESTVKTRSKSGPLQSHLVASQGALVLSKRAALLNQAGRAIPTVAQLAKPVNYSGFPGSELSAVMAVSTNDDGEHMSQQQQAKNMGERTMKVDTAKYVANVPGDPKFAFVPSACGPQGKGARSSVGSLDRYPLEDLFGRDAGDAKEVSTSTDDDANALKPALRAEKPTSDVSSKEDLGTTMEIPKPEQPPLDGGSFVAPPTNGARSVCMRDMGTEMTPIASVEPSRTATPICATTPTLRSPLPSRPATPTRGNNLTTTPTENYKKSEGELKHLHQYTDKELQSKTRQEILALGTQLGKHNIAAWATKEEEEEDAFKSLKSNVDLEEVRRNVLAARAAAWEEAEQSKYLARYNREEAKIQAWENHEKAKAEAEMRRIEVKIERMRSHANEKLMNKFAAARRHSEELRAAAAARRGEQASKTAQRAEYIRRTGKVPGSVFASLCCS